MITDTRSRNVTAAQAQLPARCARLPPVATGVPPGGLHMDLADIDLCDPGSFVNGVPYEWFAQLRAEAPVY